MEASCFAPGPVVRSLLSSSSSEEDSTTDQSSSSRAAAARERPVCWGTRGAGSGAGAGVEEAADCKPRRWKGLVSCDEGPPAAGETMAGEACFCILKKGFLDSPLSGAADCGLVIEGNGGADGAAPLRGSS